MGKGGNDCGEWVLDAVAVLTVGRGGNGGRFGTTNLMSKRKFFGCSARTGDGTGVCDQWP